MRVVVAMSGGVDSSVAAALLHREGRQVIGVTMRTPDPPGSAAASACCGRGPNAGADARRVAEQLGIPFYLLDARAAFEREVIAPFARAYASGQTPNPCVACNARLKFGWLLQVARAAGASHVATGHYARVNETGVLRVGADAAHDQSYFLYALTRAQLARALFPLGGLSKPEVRGLAEGFGLPVADKPASQDICFVGDEGYRRYLERRQAAAATEGAIVDRQGYTLGTHRGIGAYTVGQRRGLGIAAAEPLYVLAIDPGRNRVVVGSAEALLCDEVTVASLNWLGDARDASAALEVRTRHRGAPQPGRVEMLGDGRARVRFLSPHPRVAPGQAVVFYGGERVLGGGVAETERDEGRLS